MASAKQRALILACLAAISAVLGYSFWNVLFVGFRMLPGAFFGIALTLAMWLWVSRRPFYFLFVFVSSLIAWFGAEHTAAITFVFIVETLNKAGPLDDALILFLFAIPGLVGGLVGSTTLTLALALICKEFRLFKNWGRVVMAGTALGVLILFYFDFQPLAYFSVKDRPLPLLLPWQMVVAALIGYIIVPRILPKKKRVMDLEQELDHLLRSEAAGRLKPGLLVEQLDFPEFKEKRPDLREALLKRLKELGRVPQDKD